MTWRDITTLNSFEYSGGFTIANELARSVASLLGISKQINKSAPRKLQNFSRNQRMVRRSNGLAWPPEWSQSYYVLIIVAKRLKVCWGTLENWCRRYFYDIKSPKVSEVDWVSPSSAHSKPARSCDFAIVLHWTRISLHVFPSGITMGL